MKLLLTISTAMFFLASTGIAQVPVKIEDIGKHIGDSVKVCTKISGGRFFSRMPDAPTLLDAGGVYPNNTLIIFIAKKDRANFEDSPEMMYVYKDVCITGKVQFDKERQKLKIIITTPEQIVLIK